MEPGCVPTGTGGINSAARVKLLTKIDKVTKARTKKPFLLPVINKKSHVCYKKLWMI